MRQECYLYPSSCSPAAAPSFPHSGRGHRATQDTGWDPEMDLNVEKKWGNNDSKKKLNFICWLPAAEVGIECEV